MLERFSTPRQPRISARSDTDSTWPTSWITFLCGTVVSTLGGLIAAMYFDDPRHGLLVGLMVESIAVMSAIWARLSEAEERIRNHYDNSLVFSQAASRVAELGDPSYTKRFRHLREECRELAEGRYRLRTLEAVYDDDIRSTAALSPPERLRSICPVAREEDAIKKQLGNRSYTLSIREHCRAAGRGVQADRVYIFLRGDHYRLPVVQEHLNELVKNGVRCHYAIRDDPEFERVRHMDSDFMVFGNSKVSIGDISPSNGTVRGATVQSDLKTVQRFQEDFDTLVEIAKKHVTREVEP